MAFKLNPDRISDISEFLVTFFTVLTVGGTVLAGIRVYALFFYGYGYA